MDHPYPEGWTRERILAGDLAALERRIAEDGEFLERPEAFGETPLMTAVGYERPDTVRILLARGADPDPDVSDGETPLLIACGSEDPASAEIAGLLIEAGADLRRRGTNGWTGLHMAAADGPLETVRRLVDAGAEVDSRSDPDGETPLMLAAFEGRPEVVRVLLERGADAGARDWILGRSAIDLAREGARGPQVGVIEQIERALPAEEFERVLDEATQGLTPQIREALRESRPGGSPAEVYHEAATERARRGDHAAVLRLLEEHQGRSG